MTFLYILEHIKIIAHIVLAGHIEMLSDLAAIFFDTFIKQSPCCWVSVKVVYCFPCGWPYAEFSYALWCWLYMGTHICCTLYLFFYKCFQCVHTFASEIVRRSTFINFLWLGQNPISVTKSSLSRKSSLTLISISN